MTAPIDREEVRAVINMALNGLIDDLVDLADDGADEAVIREELDVVDLVYRFGEPSDD